MDEAQIRGDERKRIVAILQRYFAEGGPGTFRALIDYLGLDYRTGMDEGWLDLNNAFTDYGQKVAVGERVP